MIQTVGVIGLGVMGAPMAANLAAGGFDVVGFSRRPSAAAALERRGGRAAGTIADAVKGADVVITVLSDGPAVAEVVLGEDGVLAHASPGLLLVDMSTIDVATTRRVAEAAATRAVKTLDAPVSGGEQGAVDGTLSIMVGGDQDDFEAVLPAFEKMGRTILHLGPAGTGQIVKAANQLLVGGTLALLAEAMVFLEAHDVDMTKALEVLAGGLAGSKVLERRGPSMLARDFRPGFRIDLHHKDLGIVIDAARTAGVSVPVTGLVAQLFAAARAQGYGASDHTAVVTLIESLAGRSTGSSLS
jgi:2-hydroxy-3-oxopropionate reductase